MNWTPSSRYDATAAYVSSPDVNVVMPFAVLSSRFPASVILLAGMMLDELVTSSIWTPSSMYDATAIYVPLPNVNVVIPLAPSSS